MDRISATMRQSKSISIAGFVVLALSFAGFACSCAFVLGGTPSTSKELSRLNGLRATPDAALDPFQDNVRSNSSVELPGWTSLFSLALACGIATGWVASPPAALAGQGQNAEQELQEATLMMDIDVEKAAQKARSAIEKLGDDARGAEWEARAKERAYYDRVSIEKKAKEADIARMNPKDRAAAKEQVDLDTQEQTALMSAVKRAVVDESAAKRDEIKTKAIALVQQANEIIIAKADEESTIKSQQMKDAYETKKEAEMAILNLPIEARDEARALNNEAFRAKLRLIDPNYRARDTGEERVGAMLNKTGQKLLPDKLGK